MAVKDLNTILGSPRHMLRQPSEKIKALGLLDDSKRQVIEELKQNTNLKAQEA